MQVQSGWQRCKGAFSSKVKKVVCFGGRRVGPLGAPGEPVWKSVIKKIARIVFLILYGIAFIPSFAIGLVLSNLLKLTEPSKKIVLKTDKLESGLDKLISKKFKVDSLAINRGRGELLTLSEPVVGKILKLSAHKLKLETRSALPDSLLNPVGKSYCYRKKGSSNGRVQVLVRKALREVHELSSQKIDELEEELKKLEEADFPIDTLKIKMFLTKNDVTRIRPLLDKVNARHTVMVL